MKHPINGWSGTDNEAIASFHGDWFVAMVHTPNGWRARYEQWQPVTLSVDEVPVNVYREQDNELERAVKAEVEAKVKHHVYTAPAYSYGVPANATQPALLESGEEHRGKKKKKKFKREEAAVEVAEAKLESGWVNVGGIIMPLELAVKKGLCRPDGRLTRDYSDILDAEDLFDKESGYGYPREGLGI